VFVAATPLLLLVSVAACRYLRVLALPVAMCLFAVDKACLALPVWSTSQPVLALDHLWAVLCPCLVASRLLRQEAKLPSVAAPPAVLAATSSCMVDLLLLRLLAVTSS
jgi:hypothetical protein